MNQKEVSNARWLKTWQFKLFLLFVAVYLVWRSRFSSAIRERLAERDVGIQLGSKLEGVGRSFDIRGGKVSSSSAAHSDPSVSIEFESYDYMKSILAGEQRSTALMFGIQQQKIIIAGDASVMLWAIEVIQSMQNPAE